MANLTKSQQLILNDLIRLPAARRHHRQPGGTIPLIELAHFDGRSLRGLYEKEHIIPVEYGVIVR